MAAHEKETMKRERRRKRRSAFPSNNSSHNVRLSHKQKEVRKEREGNVTSDDTYLIKATKAVHETNGSKAKPTGTTELGRLPRGRTKNSLTSSSDEGSDSSSEKHNKGSKETKKVEECTSSSRKAIGISSTESCGGSRCQKDR
uniref:BACK domain-containing protein n=1 Tax=Parascaris univalens TaxID=6257 RepID=A0A914ZZ37_PARUN